MEKRILLIDDDQDDSSLFFDALAEVDKAITCYMAEDWDAAIAVLTNSPTIDYIFLDVHLPFSNGWEYLANLKKMEAYKEIPVVIYTTSSYKRDVQIAEDLGAACFVSKSNTFEQLKLSLEKTLSHFITGKHKQGFALISDESITAA